MLFRKSILFPYFLAQALVQRSVFADESKVQSQNNASCLIPGRKCIEGKNGYDQCVDGKSEFVECKADQKCIIVDKNFSSCVPRDNEQECEKGYDKCIDGLNGHALCYKGRLSFLKCNPDQECHNYSDTNALCRKIVKPSCLIPGRKCVEGKNGYDQCVDGKSEFVECKADQKCIIVDKNFSSCVPRDNEQECEKGYDKCIDGLNGHALCYKGRLSFLKCNPDQECHNYSDTNALCRKIVKPSCLIPGRKC
ncbi:hypothetical protein BB561_003473, partial [Smittium simulii]